MDKRSSCTYFARALAIAALLLLAGCSSSSKSSSSSSSSSSSTTSPGRSLTVNTPEGSVSLSLDGKLPPGWPSGFPVPSGATPAGSGSIGGSKESHMIAVFDYSGTGQDAFDFYKNNSTLTVNNATSVGTGKAFVGRMELTGSYSGSVTVTGYNGQTYIVVYLNNAKGTPVSGSR
jgi:ABC-type Fe3+-hydroxamate transport system substrate-binding protein